MNQPHADQQAFTTSLSPVAGVPARTLVMGIVNVTPDSFSDGGRWLDARAAIEHGRRLVAEGADIIDVGGESTRPGAVRPEADEERARVLPVIEALAGEGVTVSLDTMRADVAAAGVGAGARIVNDVSGGLADPAMLDTVAGLDADYVCMHWRGLLGDGDTNAHYADVVDDVLAELAGRRAACLAAGIAPGRVILDPGYGFSKDADQNWQLLAALDQFQQPGHRLLVGVSRKRFLGSLLDDREPTGRDAASAALTFEAARLGVWAVRTHTARAHRDAVTVAERLAAARRQRASRTGMNRPASRSGTQPVTEWETR